MGDELLRIGELARRTGVSAPVLRAWERRYGVLRPRRSGGGYRLYGSDDARRVRAMRELVAGGVAPAEAARLLAATEGASAERAAGDPLELARALDAFDDLAAQRAFDQLAATLSVEALLRDVVLPYLRELGRRWDMAEASVAQEHFASNVLRGRLLGLARGWDGGSGPRALLLCPTGEEHDLGLVCFGLMLRARGWGITLLGRDTPTEAVEIPARRLEPDAVVVAALTPGPLAAAAA